MSGIVGFLNDGLKKLRLQSLQRIGSQTAVLDLIKVMCGRQECALQLPQSFTAVVVDRLAEVREPGRACRPCGAFRRNKLGTDGWRQSAVDLWT